MRGCVRRWIWWDSLKQSIAVGDSVQLALRWGRRRISRWFTLSNNWTTNSKWADQSRLKNNTHRMRTILTTSMMMMRRTSDRAKITWSLTHQSMQVTWAWAWKAMRICLTLKCKSKRWDCRMTSQLPDSHPSSIHIWNGSTSSRLMQNSASKECGQCSLSVEGSALSSCSSS